MMSIHPGLHRIIFLTCAITVVVVLVVDDVAYNAPSSIRSVEASRGQCAIGCVRELPLCASEDEAADAQHWQQHCTGGPERKHDTTHRTKKHDFDENRRAANIDEHDRRERTSSFQPIRTTVIPTCNSSLVDAVAALGQNVAIYAQWNEHRNVEERLQLRGS